MPTTPPWEANSEGGAGFNMESLGREFAHTLLKPKATTSSEAQSSDNLLDHFGELAGRFLKQEEEALRKFSSSVPDSSLKEVEEREFAEGQRSCLLDALGRDLFQKTTAAGAAP